LAIWRSRIFDATILTASSKATTSAKIDLLANVHGFN
jgi:hypothetical protein